MNNESDTKLDQDTKLDRNTEILRITDDMMEVLLMDVDYINLIYTLTPWWIEEVVMLEPRIDSTVTWEITVKYEGLRREGCARTSEHLVSVLNYLQHNGFRFCLTEKGGVYTVTAEKPNLDISY